MKSERTEFKGFPLIKLMGEERKDSKGNIQYWPTVSLGVRKARLVLEHVDDIRAFVEEQDKLEAQKEENRE